MYGLNPVLATVDLKGDWGVNLELTAIYLSTHQATAGPKDAIWELGSLRQTQVQGSRWQLLKHELVARRNYGPHSEAFPGQPVLLLKSRGQQRLGGFRVM